MKIVMLLFERFTQLDLTGPYEVFCRMPEAEVLLVAKEEAPVVSEHGMRFIPDLAIGDCEHADILFIPGGYGVNEVMQDANILAFIARINMNARYITSTCTGALVLGAAGLLKNKNATTHWRSLPFLEPFGARVSKDRVVIDGKIVTGGGVTAGIDFALRLAAEIFSETVAKEIQLMLEYNPEDRFRSGHPDLASSDTVDSVKKKTGQAFEVRQKIIAEIVSKNQF